MTPEDKVAELARGFAQELAFEQRLLEGRYDQLHIQAIGLSVPVEFLAMVFRDGVAPCNRARMRQILNDALDLVWSE